MVTRPLALLAGAWLALVVAACSDRTGPAVASSLEIVAGDAQQATVAGTLPQPLSARVLDGRGRPVAAATVRWSTASGYGSVQPASSTTTADGMAETVWTLGPLAGEQELIARVEAAGLERRFRAEALPGSPANLHAADGDQQTGETGEALFEPLVVRVVDEFGNVVPAAEVTWAVTSGEGSLSAATSFTDATGHAAVTWTLGGIIGEQRVTAMVGGATRTFTAMAGSVNFNLILESVHLNQGIQNDTGGVGGVARRPGLLRVVVRATEPNVVRPDVLVEFFVPGRGRIGEVLVPAPAAGVPTAPELGNSAHTWNLPLAADDVVAGLAIVATVDPAATIPVLDRTDNRFPRDTALASLDVAPLHPFRLTFFPIRANNTLARLSDNVDAYLVSTRRWIPAGAITPVVGPVFTTDHDVSTGAGWTGLLADLQAKRIAEGATDEYYHGIVPDLPGSGIAGIAYVPPSPASPFRSGLTFDRLPAAADVVAHELGHNLGRLHAPSPGCSTPANIDPAFPYTNGGIGWPAYDVLNGQLLHASFRDYMGYCNSVWTSDYTYAGILGWRRNDPLVPTAAGPPSAAAPAGVRQARPGLLIWGTVGAQGVRLNPAVALEAPPVLPQGTGPYTLRGATDDGAEAFRLAFQPVQVAHAPDPEEAHFAFFVPLDPARIDALARVEVAGPRGRAVREARPSAGPGQPDVGAARLERAGARELRLRWAAHEEGVALVRDAATGRVLAIARRDDLRVDTGPLAAEHVEVLVSDGVATRRTVGPGR